MIGAIDNSAKGYGPATGADQNVLNELKKSSGRFDDYVRQQVEQSDPVTEEDHLKNLENALLAMADNLRPTPQKACADTIESMKQQGFGDLVDRKFKEMLLDTAYDIWPAGQKITTVT
ncbi:MAG: hypothetical protein PHV30_08510 [Candidatus Margulisbacteria bacterium]|nr:hypothetical protein [Candidatus Margulisiibacteriota bacterium]